MGLLFDPARVFGWSGRSAPFPCHLLTRSAPAAGHGDRHRRGRGRGPPRMVGTRTQVGAVTSDTTYCGLALADRPCQMNNRPAFGSLVVVPLPLLGSRLGRGRLSCYTLGVVCLFSNNKTNFNYKDTHAGGATIVR
eukprot:1016794-Prorocentrum_minimum.AAC.4